MLKILSHLSISALAIIISAYLIPGVSVTFFGAFVVAIVLGVINISIKPLVKFVTLPITIITLGLFSLFINALFVVVVDKIVPGFSISSFWTAFIFSIVLSLVNYFFNKLKD